MTDSGEKSLTKAEEGGAPLAEDAGLPLLSVVVPTCGRPLFLSAALDALLGQATPPMEILVVDNAPGDPSTRRLLEEIYPSCRHLSENRRGVAFARNRGLAAARGEVVVFMDDDCVCRKDWLTVIARQFGKNPRLGCCTGSVFPLEVESPAQIFMERRGGFSKGDERRLFGQDIPGCPEKVLIQVWRFGTGANMAFRRRDLLEIGGFDETLRTAEDLDAFFRMLRRGSELIYEPEAVVYHRHVRDVSELRERLYFWGWGYLSFLAKVGCGDGKFRRAALREILGWFGYQLRERLVASLLHPGEAVPPALVLAEIRGGTAGLIRHLIRTAAKRCSLSHRRGDRLKIPVEKTVRGSNAEPADRPEVTIVVAMTEDRVIGAGNRIPWHIHEELQTFRRLTSGGVVIMGRKTFESIGRPLPDRINLILSRTLDSVEGAEVVGGFEEALRRAVRYNRQIFLIGGRKVYRRALEVADSMYISWIPNGIEGDVKFPDFDLRQWEPVEEKSFETFRLTLYRRKDN